MTDYIDKKAIAAINEIIRRGNNAVIRRNKQGVIVQEEIRKTKYCTAPIEER